MGCPLSSARRAQLQANLATKQKQLIAANALMDHLLADPTSSSSIDTGEGRQQFSNRKLEDVQKQIDVLQSEINRIQNKLLGGGIVNMTLRRNR